MNKSRMIYGYMRASTKEQDSLRSEQDLLAFAKQNNFRYAMLLNENISGATIDRPELNKIIQYAESGDCIVIEKLDRLSRLPYELWKVLRNRIEQKGVYIVVLDQPMTHGFIHGDDQTGMMKVLTDFMISLAAQMARDDYETRRYRVAQGLAKAKAQGVRIGRKPNIKKLEYVKKLLLQNYTWAEIRKEARCGQDMIRKARAELNNNQG
ncbi:MAG: recombinase family protein [Cellvibrionales bacterium]|nr:recombinase family protein [Cellvibrionales bacterium]